MKVKKGRSPSPGKRTSPAPKKEIVQEKSLKAEESTNVKSPNNPVKVKKGRSPSPGKKTTPAPKISPSTGKKTSPAPKRKEKEIVQEESLKAKESTNVKSPRGRSPASGKKTTPAPKSSPSPGKKTTPVSKRKEKEVVQEKSLKAEESTNVKSPNNNPTKVKKGRSPSPGKKTTPATKRSPSPGKKASPATKRKQKEIVQEESLEAEESSSEKQSDQEDANYNSDDYASDDSEEPKKGRVFSDNNAKWLKPKQDLISSDEEDEVGGDDEMLGVLGDDDDDSSVEMEVEKKSRLLDAKTQEEEDEAEEDMREAVSKHTAIYHLPTKEELEMDLERVVPPSEVRSHIEQILEVLAHFKERREPGRTRSEYVDQLGIFIAELYGYLPELIEYFLTMFSPAECLEFVDYSDKARPLVIRTNTLKTRRKDLALALMKRGVTLDPLASWSKVGLKIIESSVPIGATPEYLSGHYMLQSAASMCPVLALAPQANERVLDMSAAPGGKTSYMAQLMRNTGVIFANDLKPDRQKATVANMHRLGVKNVIACTHDGRKMPKLFQHYKFDRILLDAPCSGLGVISRDPSCKVQRTLTDVGKTAHLQKELLLACIDMLNHKSKTGGVMVYSTCSVSVAENEEVVDYALKKRHIKIIATGLDFGASGFTRYQDRRFHPSVALTRRFYPHVHNMDGFFVCKIQKLSDEIPGEKKLTDEEKAAAEVEEKRNKKAEAPKQPTEVPKRTKKPKKKGKKRAAPEDEPEKGMAPKMSIPPTMHNQNKKKKVNAKMSKPRRVKIENIV